MTPKRVRLPCGLGGEAEALTQDRGWVPGFDLEPGDKILTKNIVTGGLGWQPIWRMQKLTRYAGPLIEFKSRVLHLISTPGHRWLTQSGWPFPHRRRAPARSVVPVSGGLKGKGDGI